MSASLTPSPKMQFFDANGDPLVGGKLYTYAAGTTTPLVTYTDSTGGTPNANPVVLNSRGEASVWLGTSAYYFELKDSAGSLIWTADNITGQITPALVQSGVYQWLSSVSGADKITASASPVPSAYAAGQTFRFVSSGANTGAATLNISSLGAKSITKNGTTVLVAGDIPSGAVVEVTYDGTQFQLINVKASNITVPTGIAKGNGSTFSAATDGTDYISPAYAHSCNGFRLTLTTAVPVTTTDVTGATTIYCSPYKGNEIALYTGSAWVVLSSAEVSLALGTLTSGKPYDIFGYNNAGTFTLESLAWTNDTTRATALAYQDGVLVKSGAATRRYLGSFYTTSTTTTEDSQANRYLYNFYHRVARNLYHVESTASWAYTTATWRQANGSAANLVNAMVGTSDGYVELDVRVSSSNGTPVSVGVGIGIDSTTVNSAQVYGAYVGALAPVMGGYRGNPGVGKHAFNWIEISQAAGGTTWYATSTYQTSGIYGIIQA